MRRERKAEEGRQRRNGDGEEGRQRRSRQAEGRVSEGGRGDR